MVPLPFPLPPSPSSHPRGKKAQKGWSPGAVTWLGGKGHLLCVPRSCFDAPVRKPDSVSSLLYLLQPRPAPPAREGWGRCLEDPPWAHTSPPRTGALCCWFPSFSASTPGYAGEQRTPPLASPQSWEHCCILLAGAVIHPSVLSIHPSVHPSILLSVHPFIHGTAHADRLGPSLAKTACRMGRILLSLQSSRPQ